MLCLHRTVVCAVSFLLCLFLIVPLGFSQGTVEPQANYLFRDTYYAPPSLKLQYEIYEMEGLLVIKDSRPFWHSQYSVVTGFSGPVVESRVLKNIKDLEEARDFIQRNMRKIYFERIPIRELPLTNKEGKPTSLFWVGQKAFESLKAAQSSIAETKAVIELKRGDFDRSIELIDEYYAEEPAPTQAEIIANYEREEELAIKMMDWLGVGEDLYGPFTGEAMGERILWQSFGETSFRDTNLDNTGYDDQVAFWTNRMVFKGIRFFGEATIDPYVEVTAAFETNGKDYATHMDLVGGLEYRPFSRSAFLYNFDLFGFNILRFMRNYRFYVQYMERKNLTDEIALSRDNDLWAGIDMFYEWGIDLERPWITWETNSLTDVINQYVWGEYFGNYRWQKTDFSTNDSFHSWIFNSNVHLGVKWPRIPLPSNPVNDEFLLMPYVRLEHTTNPNRETESQNRLFVAAGVRWMPFRSYQFEHNEWLFKTKFFAEYVGIGGVEHPGPAKGVTDVPERDWRFGVSVAFNRY